MPLESMKLDHFIPFLPSTVHTSSDIEVHNIVKTGGGTSGAAGRAAGANWGKARQQPSSTHTEDHIHGVLHRSLFSHGAHQAAVAASRQQHCWYAQRPTAFTIEQNFWGSHSDA